MSNIIAIVGGSCSGKTTLAGHLHAKLGLNSGIIIRQDDYYFDIRDRVSDGTIPNFDIPEAIDFDALCDDVAALKAGKSVALPNYDFGTHMRVRASAPIGPRRYIIIEGMLLLTCPKMRELIDYSYYIKCPTHLRFARRLTRDVAERKRSEDFVSKQFHKHVEPAHQAFVKPSSIYADTIIDQEEYTSNLDALLEVMATRCRVLAPIGEGVIGS